MRDTVRYTYSKPGKSAQGAVFAHATFSDDFPFPREVDTTVGVLSFHPPMAFVDIDDGFYASDSELPYQGSMISTAQARIANAGVSESMQGQGIGSEMYRIAQRELNSPLGHSGSLTSAGHRFAKSVGGHIPDMAKDAPTMRHGIDPGVLISLELKDHRGKQRPVPGSPRPEPAQHRTLSPQFEQLSLW